MKTLSQNTTSSACAPETGLQQLVATIVPDEQRISFWPQHFGLIPQWVTLEPRVFGWMDRLCENYCGGIWNLYTLNNGGAFMAPEPDDYDDETWVLFNAMNGNRAEMSPEAAGIAACLMTYSHHACRTENYAMTVHYYRLRDYALQHLSDDVQSSRLSYGVLCHDGPLLPAAGLRPAASGMQRHYAHY